MPAASPGLLGLSQRLPPSNIQAEQALLGAILANNKAYDRVAEFLQPHHFADAVHGHVYAAIVRRIECGMLADAVTLKADFEHSGQLADVGGVTYLAQLLTAMVGIINAGEYGRAIHDAWLRRQLIDIGEETVNLAFGAEPDQSGADVMAVLDERLTALGDGAGDTAPLVPLGDAVSAALRVTQEAANRGDGLAGISTGFAALDRMLKGLMKADLVVLGARPGMGKTALGLSIAVRAAAAVRAQLHTRRVLFWSGEMTAEQLAARVAAAGARLPTTAVFSGFTHASDLEARPGELRTLNTAEWDALEAARWDAATLPLELDCRPSLTVPQLRARARKLKRGPGLELVVVDYVGLMRPPQALQNASLYQQLTAISNALLGLAKELDVPVLALAQINREVEKRTNKRPIASDLRDSGALEQDATRLMFVHRPQHYLRQAGPPSKGAKQTEDAFQDDLREYYAALKSSAGVAEIIVAKNRHGPDGITRLHFQDQTTWFFDEQEPADAPAWPRIPRG